MKLIITENQHESIHEVLAAEKLATYFEKYLGQSYSIDENFLLKKFGLDGEFKGLGSGQSGFVFLNSHNHAVKVTKSKHEYEIASKLKGKSTNCFAIIYETFKCTICQNDVYVIIRKYYSELLDEYVSEKIAEEYEEIYAFFRSKQNMSPENYNFYHYLDEKILSFLTELKKESLEHNILPHTLDVVEGGIANNIAIENGQYKLFDF